MKNGKKTRRKEREREREREGVMTAFVWDATVSDPQKFDGKSVTYLIEVRTDLPEFGKEGTPVEGAAEGERKITVRRRFGEIQTFRNALDKIAPKGCGLPALPAKNFFNRFDPKVIEERRKTFEVCTTTITTTTITTTTEFFIVMNESPVEDGQTPPRRRRLVRCHAKKRRTSFISRVNV